MRFQNWANGKICGRMLVAGECCPVIKEPTWHHEVFCSMFWLEDDYEWEAAIYVLFLFVSWWLDDSQWVITVGDGHRSHWDTDLRHLDQWSAPLHSPVTLRYQPSLSGPAGIFIISNLCSPKNWRDRPALVSYKYDIFIPEIVFRKIGTFQIIQIKMVHFGNSFSHNNSTKYFFDSLQYWIEV